MRWWWVNQNQTYDAEFNGGYMWSPKRNKNGARNQFYENMRSVVPGDLVFSFRNSMIVAVGRIESYGYDAPKPKEFGTSGANWELNGWMVDVRYSKVTAQIRPKAHIDRIRPFLPSKYSPLQESGDGLQSVYLAEVPQEMATLLLDLLREAGNDVEIAPSLAHESDHRDQVVSQVEDDLESAIENAPGISITEKVQIVKARRGQGRFRQQLLLVEKACRLSGITDAQFLIASHIKPWRDANNAERLDGHNGLLLSPNFDFLFDRGFISFEDNGLLLISPIPDESCLRRLGIPIDGPVNVGAFSSKQKEYLSYHRRNVYLESGRDD